MSKSREEWVEEVKEKFQEAYESMEEERRCLALMEAGLKELPLEKDFVAFQRYKYQDRKKTSGNDAFCNG